ncbi:MAG: cobalt-precorrin-7 (C(5))-methyltransferase [Fibrobacteres bacterium]|nr:cobalt-precorrin-7 (C(5))-methyltransferase [Fibrobacterota bacterium]QQS03442.1 MAG: cobalt-precorrin-7 (C(5))-methyltransferase [Fibrobacterota bacterium]
MTEIVHLVGCGPGGPDWVPPRAREIVRKADVIFGPSDLQDLFPEAPGARMDLPARPENAAPLVLAALGRRLGCAVLVRGDCGLHSLAKGLQSRLPAGACRRIAGVSSVQVACAAFGLDWQGARILSAHGRPLQELGPDDRQVPLVVVLGGGERFHEILERTREALGPWRLHLASDVTLPTESLRTIAPGERIPSGLPSRTIALFERTGP